MSPCNVSQTQPDLPVAHPMADHLMMQVQVKNYVLLQYVIKCDDDNTAPEIFSFLVITLD